jgi:hypothetical protein
VTAAALVDLDTGEHVPGVTVTPPRGQRVSIRPDRDAAKAAAAQVRAALRTLRDRQTEDDR